MRIRQCCRITENNVEVAFYESEGERFTLSEILAIRPKPGQKATWFVEYGVVQALDIMREAVEMFIAKKSSRTHTHE